MIAVVMDEKNRKTKTACRRMQKMGFWCVLNLLAVLLCVPGLGAGAETIAMIADLHMTSEPDAFEETLSAIERLAEQADILVFLGDNTNNGRTEEHTAFLAYLEKVRAEKGKTVCVIPGNHDLTGSTTPEVFSARYAHFGWNDAFEKDENSASYAVMTPEGTCLLMLDNNAYDPNTRMTEYGETGGSLVAWAAKVLDGLKDGTDVLAFGHYPLLPFGDGRDSTRNAQAMADLLMSHSVRLYCCGHRHSNYTLVSDALRQINIGVPTGYPAWAGMLEKEENAWHYRVQPLYDPQGETWAELKQNARTLGEKMGEGSLAGTEYAGNEEAVLWFADAFMAQAESTMDEKRDELKAREGYAIWQKAQVRSVTKEWILGILDNEDEDVRDLLIPLEPSVQPD